MINVDRKWFVLDRQVNDGVVRNILHDDVSLYWAYLQPVGDKDVSENIASFLNEEMERAGKSIDGEKLCDNLLEVVRLARKQ